MLLGHKRLGGRGNLASRGQLSSGGERVYVEGGHLGGEREGHLAGRGWYLLEHAIWSLNV